MGGPEWYRERVAIHRAGLPGRWLSRVLSKATGTFLSKEGKHLHFQKPWPSFKLNRTLSGHS